MSARPFCEREIRLLLVDDDDDDHVLIEGILEEATGAAVRLDRAVSGPEALALMAQSRYDVFLFDYRLGETDGIELLRECKARGLSTPVIFLTGQGDEQIAVEAMKAGASD